MEQPPPASNNHRLIWIYPDNLLKKLNASPTLEVTRGLRQTGWQVDLLMGGINGPQIIRGVEVTGVPRPDRAVVRQFIYHARALKFVLDRWNTTSIVFLVPISAPWILPLRIAGLLKRGKRPLIVMDTRTMQMDEGTLKTRLRGKLLPGLNLLANWFADGQTAITRRMAEACHIRRGKLWGVWPSAVDLNVFLQAAVSRRWPQGEEPVQIVYVGVLTPERDLMPLCRAVEKANQEGMCFELTLVGDGIEYENLAAFAAQTAGRVRLLGRVPHDQVPSILSKMHVGALPFPDELKFRVSSPIKLYEYLGAGMPVLATRIVCHTDIIGDRTCAFWAENSTVDGLAASLRVIWKNREAFAEWGRQAAELAQEYTWKASAKKLSIALESGLAKHGRVAS